MRARMLGVALIIVVATLAPPRGVIPRLPPAEAGGMPTEGLPADWHVVRTTPDGDIMRTLATTPHDPNLMGVRAARALTKEYGTASSSPTTFEAADGTPLAGRIAVSHVANAPGVVLVNGLTSTKEQRTIVELAELFLRNGWHVLAIDARGHGASRRLSPAMITFGWKEADDILAAARTLRERTSVSSVAVIGFSLSGRSLVRAMAQDQGKLIQAGIAVGAPLAALSGFEPPPPGWTPNRIQQYFLDFLGASSFFEYYQRSARSYGLDLETLAERVNGGVDQMIARVARPLLMMYALDDGLALAEIKRGRHDGGVYSLAYRDRVRDHPHVKTLLVDRGSHAEQQYLSDPHWFALISLTWLKHWQARDNDGVTVAAPPLDVLAEGALDGELAHYRLVVRNHGPRPVGPVDLHLQLPADARLETCWVGFEGLGRCSIEGRRVSWTMPRLPSGKSPAGPFVATIDTARLKRGPFEVRAWVTTADGKRDSFDEGSAASVPQPVWLIKP